MIITVTLTGFSKNYGNVTLDTEIFLERHMLDFFTSMIQACYKQYSKLRVPSPL